MKVVGISGKAESGKTTFATMLKEESEAIGKKVMLINYGDFLKFIAKQYYNWNGIKDEKGRALLQHIGTERGRVINKNLWVDMVINTVTIAENDYDIAIVADCRFPNEFDRWREFNKPMLQIRIERPNHNNILTEEQKHHSSETALDNYLNFDLHIQNTDSLEVLRETAIQIVNDYLK